MIGNQVPSAPRLGARQAGVVLAGELVLAALLYTVGAGRSGWGTAYYAAATQAGSLSWKAFLFGSLDPAGGITIDKPPASIWLSALSVRLLGLSPEAVLWPQAACGVATVALLYAVVARQAGRPAGLLAAGLLAVTPVFTLMARYNNPDELMVLLLVAAAWATVRSLDGGRAALLWTALAGAFIGAAFLTKLGQALLVLPCLALVVVVFGPGSWWRRAGHLVVGGAAAVAAAGWWVLLVQLTPPADRPYVGGSTDNSVLGLALGYDGFDRLTGSSPTGHSPDWTRLLVSGGQQAGWLLPAAAFLAVLGFLCVRRRPRTDPQLAFILLWGGWLVGVGVVLSSLKGTLHSYYSVQLTPAAAALVAIGVTLLWDRSRSPARQVAVPARWALAGTVVGSAMWMAGLVSSATPWGLAVAGAVVLTGLAAAGVLLVGPGASRSLRGLAASLAVLSAWQLQPPCRWRPRRPCTTAPGRAPGWGTRRSPRPRSRPRSSPWSGRAPRATAGPPVCPAGSPPTSNWPRASRFSNSGATRPPIPSPPCRSCSSGCATGRCTTCSCATGPPAGRCRR
ncbi:glycosyltransferase family 39 protein [Klenkia sp. PcliD-1-E]|uniref:ArnT family glycosyltransferase n=1 Tax=Klenkia sp. PcliD-1-E TaxID=2954492 RepID=UPI0020974E62|nr:glycosyltransferase family 39 protein [Klenkia sp. PcliD-1-E]MCO7218391.1 glycosyltransferase family 39 protein [Klenkia sp. PcliD-1-E]